MVRRYVALSAEDRAVLWGGWARGETMQHLSRALGCPRSTVWWEITRRGGMAPRAWQRAACALTAAEREEISRGLVAGESLRSMARRVGRAPSTISREIRRHGGGQEYRASQAEATACQRARRPKPGRLVAHRRLRQLVDRKLRADWSPQQIAVWLVTTFPDDPALHVSHETIYRTLYCQARGALKRDLVAHLRRQRGVRRPRAAARTRDGRGLLLETVSIAERPPSADTRAVPGHWEGDLLMGNRGSQIATLVERQSRFVLLVRLPAATSTRVVTALARCVQRLPAALRQSLTWDRGKEMAQHARFTMATEMQVYFCDPYSPWQRGSNENTNGLLRQYFPKGFDFRAVTQRQLDVVARKLNTRPRHTLGWNTPAAVLEAIVASTG